MSARDFSISKKTIQAWHFTNGRALRDGSKWKVGKIERHSEALFMCQSGLHASRNPLDALKYAPGTMIRRVKCGGQIIEDNDKLVCTKRKVLWAYDAAKVLRHFARLCALDVIHLWKAPEVVIKYLRTGDNKLQKEAYNATCVARNAAYNAACNTAHDAAYYAAYAAYNAARDADVARDTTYTANAAYYAARDVANATDAVSYAAYYAARNATRNAANAADNAAKQKQSKRLVRMLLEGKE